MSQMRTVLVAGLAACCLSAAGWCILVVHNHVLPALRNRLQERRRRREVGRLARAYASRKGG
jgi:hypothetical protein